ncbi:MAG: RluA family pseudouridine synthase [Bacteroidales bacterium]|nr:RluA family pseudouridine synthase [Bacteroidales bacterium]MCF8337713.1 RluA family pseudouridine synthase [Bacteroidales bacterium]
MSEETFNSQELYEHYRFVADTGQRPLRIDKFLMNLVENTTRNKIQNAAKAGNILVNEQPVKQNYKVKPGDIISVVLTYPPQKIELIPENLPLNIIHEDDDILVVNKEAGMVVHPGYANYTGTLLNALLHHFEKNNEEEQPHLVHRIDKDTSGLLLVAKNELAQSRLAKQFFEHTIERKYQALVWGDFKEDSGTIKGNLDRHPKDRRVMTVFPDSSKGKEATTHFRVLQRFTYVTLVECKLETGRTHQIRAHMKYIKHPLFNDAAYGGDEILKGTTFSKYKQFVKNCFKIIPRQALHAKSLGFNHPTTNKKMFFDSELPEDMTQVLEKWRNYAVHKLQ